MVRLVKLELTNPTDWDDFTYVPTRKTVKVKDQELGTLYSEGSVGLVVDFNGRLEHRQGYYNDGWWIIDSWRA